MTSKEVNNLRHLSMLSGTAPFKDNLSLKGAENEH